jgi:hypothetical protein
MGVEAGIAATDAMQISAVLIIDRSAKTCLHAINQFGLGVAIDLQGSTAL